MDALCGTYEVQKGLSLRIWSETRKIYCQLSGQPTLQLFAENEIMLFSKAVSDKLLFEKNKQGEIICLYIIKNGNGNKTKAEKIK